MDGFVRSPSGPVAMAYWDDTDIPFYWGLARQFPLCDRWFCSALAQTYPNRRFLLAGTARGDVSTSIQVLNEPAPPNGTICDLLNRHDIPWKDYYSSLPTIGLYLPVLKANTDKAVKIDQFFTDCTAGTLPAFSLVEPDFGTQSEEDPQDISLGESFASRVINAVMASPNWPDTVLIWTYDEHGGYYDHVPPPKAAVPDDKKPDITASDIQDGYDRYGIRVPAVVVSPFARKDYVSHVVHDHTSVLALLEHKFNLPALTHRDGAADDLLDALDLTGPPAFLKPPVLPKPKNPSDTTRLCQMPHNVPTA
jgi:phospholipase C